MINLEIIRQISSEHSLKEFQVNNSVQLLFEEECTIPFVARYRKEKTGSLDEVAIKSIRDRYTYLTDLHETKIRYLKVVKDHCDQKPELAGQFAALEKKFQACQTKQELEDLYLPFKPKRRTRAQQAREKGLDKLWLKIFETRDSLTGLEEIAKEYVTPEDTEAAKKVANVEDAIQGAKDIAAEKIAETAENRALIRRLTQENGQFAAKKADSVPDDPTSKEEADKLSKAQKTLLDKAKKFRDYFNYAEAIEKAASHRIMAVRRGESEKVLRAQVVVDGDQMIEALGKSVKEELGSLSKEADGFYNSALEDAFRRLIWPSIETEVRLELKKRAEVDAIKVFSNNLENLLLLPPIPDKIVLGIDPGLRTGSKLAVVDKTGKLLAHDTIYPDLKKEESPKTDAAKKIILEMIKKNNVEYIAIGNGTGSREIDKVVRDVLKANSINQIKKLVVNESGASVYSTDEIAREEFPDLDPTIRSAVSIARRLQDPLAELVKIDPRSIGVGQYQHDVNVTKLNNSLGEVVESCVNRVGVNLNTASTKLLSYVSGIGPSLAKNIVSYRDQKGSFDARNSLNNVTGFGPKAFQQSAGFLRVAGGAPLDNSAVHPESYTIVEKIAEDQSKSVADLIGDKTTIDAIPLEKYVSDEVGLPTLKDICDELIKPGRDPREDGTRLVYNDEVSEIEDLKQGMKLKGTVTNVTNFGAFVDVGVHQDGLVHISELANKFVDDPNKVVSVGDIVDVKVIEVDHERRRISFSMRMETTTASPSPRNDAKSGQSRSQGQNRGPQRGKGPRQGKGGSRPQKSGGNQKQYTMDDLLQKFNQKR